MFKKKTSNKKKALLTGAVLSALQASSVAGNIGVVVTSTTEAAEVETAQPRPLTEAERVAKGYPSIPNVTYYDDGSVLYPYSWTDEYNRNRINMVHGNISSFNNTSIVLKGNGQDKIKTNVFWGSGTVPVTDYTAFGTNGQSCNANIGWLNINGRHAGAHYNISRLGGGSCGNLFKSMKGYTLVPVNESYTTSGPNDAISTLYYNFSDNILLPTDLGASPDDTKQHMKDAGVDATGGTIKINKPMETKGISAEGNISATGNISAGGNLDVGGNSHIKGNEKVDGKLEVGSDTIIHGSETVDHNLTVKGDETVNGNSTVGKDSHIKGNETVDKNLTVHGSETVDGNSTTHGNATFDKNVKIKGDTSMDGKLDVGGDTHMHSNAEIDKNLRAHGNEEVDGDSHIHGNSEIDKDQTVHGNQHINGNQEVDKDATVYGNTDLKGDLRVEGNSRLLDDVQIGDDKNKDKFDVYAKTHLHGDTTVGDDEKDKFTVNATSEFKADATFDKDVKIKGDLETDGNSTTHGNATIDKDLHVKGNSETDGNALVHGNGVVEGDFEVKGSTKLGDDKNKDTLDVNAKTHLHGDTTIGDDKNDKLTVNATTDFAGESTFGKDVHIKGNLETDGDSRTHGNSVTDGNAIVYGNAGIAQNLTVGGNSHVFGDSVVDGDVYGRSFNVGNERYIDKDGINANNHKIRNIADGEIGPNSLDAVNGRQLWHTREALQYNINQVGAQTAAMANLHPMDFEYGDKFSLAAAVGGYQNQQAFALGAFVKPTQKSMLSLTGTLGMSQNMYGVGYTQKFGKKSDFEHMTETQLKDELVKLDKDAAEIREHDKQLKAENETLRKASRVLAKSIDENSAEITKLKAASEKANEENKSLRASNKELEKNLTKITKAYQALSDKLNGAMVEIRSLQKAHSN